MKCRQNLSSGSYLINEKSCSHECSPICIRPSLLICSFVYSLQVDSHSQVISQYLSFSFSLSLSLSIQVVLYDRSVMPGDAVRRMTPNCTEDTQRGIVRSVNVSCHVQSIRTKQMIYEVTSRDLTQLLVIAVVIFCLNAISL